MTDKYVFMTKDGGYLRWWICHSGFSVKGQYTYEVVNDINSATVSAQLPKPDNMFRWKCGDFPDYLVVAKLRVREIRTVELIKESDLK